MKNNKDKAECTCCLVLFFTLIAVVCVMGNVLFTLGAMMFLFILVEIVMYKKLFTCLMEFVHKITNGRK